MVTIPTVHLNGTGGEALRDQTETALDAVCDALTVLERAAPNARDYYVQSEDAFRHAANEHTDRVVRLRTVRDELHEILEKVVEQTERRAP